jgi:hypothetical protein
LAALCVHVLLTLAGRLGRSLSCSCGPARLQCGSISSFLGRSIHSPSRPPQAARGKRRDTLVLEKKTIPVLLEMLHEVSSPFLLCAHTLVAARCCSRATSHSHALVASRRGTIPSRSCAGSWPSTRRGTSSRRRSGRRRTRRNMSGRRRNVWNMSSITRSRRRRKGGGGRGGGRHHDARLLLVNAPSRTFSHLLGTKHTPLVPHIPLEHPRHTTTSSERFPKTQRSFSQAARGE